MTAPDDRGVRVVTLLRMFTTYDQTPSEERVQGYLAVIAQVPTAALAEAIKTAMADSDGKWPPGPGEIVAAWKSNRAARPEERPYRPQARSGAAQLSAGAALAQLEAHVEPTHEREILTLAAERRRTQPGRFPASPTQARTPSFVAAAMELGVHWPMQPDHQAQVGAWMTAATAQGRACGWWDSERRRLVTEWRGSYHAGAKPRLPAYAPRGVPTAESPSLTAEGA
jgi:hypothetical protein